MIKPLLLGKGFVGQKLNKHFTQKGIDFFNIAKNEIDYTNRRALSTLLRDYNFSHVINCSGYTGHPNVDGCESNKSDCWKYNVSVPVLIDRVCEQYNAKCIHISSGCIYTGYSKNFEESDDPNFGLFNPESSFYSKTKHAFETVVDTRRSAVLRIRMPFTGMKEDKNYLVKLLKYDNLISLKNSVTSIDDLCAFIENFLNNFTPGIYNVVNPQPIEAREVVELLKKNNLVNTNWRFIDVADLNTIAKRSNCILDTHKITSMGLCLPDTYVSLERSIKSLCS